METKLIKLYRGSCYLPPVEKAKTLSPTGNLQDIKEWWLNSKDSFKEMVLSKRTKDYDIEAVGIVIEQLPDVTIFSHEYNEKWDKHTNPQVIANEDIREIVPLFEQDEEAKIGDGAMVKAQWVDASHNNTPATIEDVKESRGVMDIAQYGFLMDMSDTRVFIGGRYNKEDKTYRYLTAIPTINLMKMVKLEVTND